MQLPRLVHAWLHRRKDTWPPVVIHDEPAEPWDHEPSFSKASLVLSGYKRGESLEGREWEPINLDALFKDGP